MFSFLFQTMSRRFRRLRRRNLGQYARSLLTSFCCSTTYIKMVKKGQKQVKNGIFHVFCPFQTISRRFRRRRRRNLGQYARSLRTSFCYSKTYIKKVKKGQKQVTNGKFYVFASFRLFFGDFVAEGDEITGRRTVHHE